MVAAAEFVSFLDNPYILGSFHHAEYALVSAGISADGTGVGFGKTAADRTAADMVMEAL